VSPRRKSRGLVWWAVLALLAWLVVTGKLFDLTGVNW
jgi:hypothetical protein